MKCEYCQRDKGSHDEQDRCLITISWNPEKKSFVWHYSGIYKWQPTEGEETPAYGTTRAEAIANFRGSTEGRAEHGNTPEAHPVKSGADSHGKPQGSETRRSGNQVPPPENSPLDEEAVNALLAREAKP